MEHHGVKMNFEKCAIMPGFHKSGHNSTLPAVVKTQIKEDREVTKQVTRYAVSGQNRVVNEPKDFCVGRIDMSHDSRGGATK